MKLKLGFGMGAMDIVGVVIDVALLFALYPAIQGFINGAEANMTAGELAISGLIPLVLVLALLYSIGRQTGVFGKR